LSGAAKIDARSLADLLDYFVRIAPHINYYDADMNAGDWQPFFRKSIPFTLASAINYPVKQLSDNFSIYTTLFDRRASSTGLQLNAHFLFYHFISRINTWHEQLRESGLPLENYLDNLIREKLRSPVIRFIGYVNAAVRSYGIKRIDFNPLYANKAWNIGLDDLYGVYIPEPSGIPARHKEMHVLNDQLKSLFPVFSGIIKDVAGEAANNITLSLVNAKEELAKKHQPHLALLFAFLNLFRHLQDDLNQYTRRHLDFFYKDILQLKSAPAVPDKAHVLFEIQKQLKKYILNKGLLLKGGKDGKKQEILFGLDDEIAVNKTEVVEKRTLFLDNQTGHELAYVEGVYIAPDATKADGVDKDFQSEVQNFPTLGAKESKWTDPLKKEKKLYPQARIGFALASPVLFLEGGTRMISITLCCRLHESICAELEAGDSKPKKSCCTDPKSPEGTIKPAYPLFLPPIGLLDYVNEVIGSAYLVINNEMLKTAREKGVSDLTLEKILVLLAYQPKKLCCDSMPLEERLAGFFDLTIKYQAWIDFLDLNLDPTIPVQLAERELLDQLITTQPLLSAFNIYFSGEKEWIRPATVNELAFHTFDAATNSLFLKLKVTVTADQAPITFFNKDQLKEDYGTDQPLVKIEINDRLKIKMSDAKYLPLKPAKENSNNCCQQDDSCTLLKKDERDRYISVYHFLRNAEIVELHQKKIAGQDVTRRSRIKVKVCGLKKLIVQNDDSLQDINGPFFPFGTIPKLESSFYIGSKEIFSKNWQQIWINGEWKDRPVDFTNYYKDYHYGIDYEDGSTDITEASFKILPAVFEKRKWWLDGVMRLFKDPSSTKAPFCDHPVPEWNQDIYHFSRSSFSLDPYTPHLLDKQPLLPLNANSSYGFLRFSLGKKKGVGAATGVTFQHHRFSYVLTRHMMAIAKLVDPLTIKPALDILNAAVIQAQFIRDKVNNEIKPRLANIPNLNGDLNILDGLLDSIIPNINDVVNNPLDLTPLNLALATLGNINLLLGSIGQNNTILDDADETRKLVGEISTRVNDVANKLSTLVGKLLDVQGKIQPNQAILGGLPNEAYTPVFKTLSVDYTARAETDDFDLIHLYPYKDTYKHENIELQPALVPTFCDEGTLFLGLSELVPGNNLNILFQLAEATSDSESDKEPVFWYYLDSNIWRPLRKGFEVLEDATDNLTSSGIVKLALPENMTNDNTVMPKDLYWIKAAIRKNSRSVSETTGIHPQAMLAEFSATAENDTLRLFDTLPKGSIAKLNIADASIKTVQQPYETFGGRIPESEGPFYVRVSELLRHKGRAIQAWDYERLVLQEFPELYKVKCISHSFALNANKYINDFPYAPGYVILAVIPDLYKLKAGFSFEPKAPVSILEKVESFIRKRTSPFVRFKACNAIYETINFCIRVQLVKGKDENYYKEKLKEDIRVFLAPWALGEFHKMSFGECVYRSDIIRFLETTGYVDFITDLKMGSKGEEPSEYMYSVCPQTPRSILVAGDIEICVEKPVCIDWNKNYKGCDDNIIPACKNEAELFIDYCNAVKK
ncbi:MAG: hypothetical protein ABIT05_09090, partial [Chitinophagaceae bacterium]